MSILENVLQKLLACVVKIRMATGKSINFIRVSFAFMLAIGTTLLVSQCTIASVISDEIKSTNEKMTSTNSNIGNLSKELTGVISRYQLTNSLQCALLVVGVSATNSASIYFIPGPEPIAGLQLDIMDNEGIKVTSTMSGSDLDAMGKEVISAPIAGGRRLLSFGINQNVFTAGNIAMLMLDTTAASKGPHNLVATNFSAASPEGNAVPLCVTSGVITK